jgi:enoyl-CoA hydratase
MRQRSPRFVDMTDPATSPISTSLDEGVAILRLDDGKANVFSYALLDALTAALDEAEASAGSILLVGRPGRFSGGFDLTEMTKGPEEAAALALAGGRVLLRLYACPKPTVVACTGSAMAAGALALLACDTRIGADMPCKIALNETAIGLAIPEYGRFLAEERLSKRHVTRALLQAETYDAAGAVAAGYLDRIVPADEVEAVALAEAKRLGALPGGAYAATKRNIRGARTDAVIAALDADLARGVSA